MQSRFEMPIKEGGIILNNMKGHKEVGGAQQGCGLMECVLLPGDGKLWGEGGREVNQQRSHF